MNDLSWILYFGAVLSQFSAFVCVLSVLVTAFTLLGMLILMDDTPCLSDFKWVKWPIIALLLVSLIPPQKTIYMIAASEMGETVITSPEAREIYEDLRKVLRSYVEKE